MTLLVGYLLGSTATLLLLLLLNAKRELPEGASVGLLLLSGFGGILGALVSRLMLL